jgi:hypothetical protein
MRQKDVSFCPLRYWIDQWDEATADEDKRARIKNLIDGRDLMLFFQHKGSVYGAPEESRIVFAKMKHPDEETGKDWVEDASFTAVNLTRALTGESVENVFTSKDVDSIGVMSEEAAEEKLLKGEIKGKTPKPKKHGREGANKIKLRDRS